MAVRLGDYGLRVAIRKVFERKLASTSFGNGIVIVRNKTYTTACAPTCSTKFVANQKPMTICRRLYSKKTTKNERNQDSDSDSDSDDEGNHKRILKDKKDGHHHERGDSDFWRRKMRTLHGVFDVNHDGVISFDDFLLLAKKFSDLGHLMPREYEEFIAVMKETWQEQWGEITPYNLVTAEQFLTDMHHALNDRDLVKKIHRFLPYIFKAVDTHHCDYIELDQYKLFFQCLGLTEEDAAVSFAVIDKNGDGKLTIKEFIKLGRDFFLTEDERRISRMFWGPLVDH